LRIEGEDMATAIGAHAGLDQDRPERWAMLRSDFALVGAGKAVYRMHGMVADNQLMCCIPVLRQHVAQPVGLDVPFTAEARPIRMGIWRRGISMIVAAWLSCTRR